MTRFAKLGLEYYFYWVHPGFVSTLTDLELSIYDDDDDLVVTSSASAITPLGLYVTDDIWLALANGRYTMNWVSTLGSIDVTETLLVASHPTGNEEVTIPSSPFIDGLTTALGDVTLDVYQVEDDGTLTLWGSSPYPTTESTQFLGRYETDDKITFSQEGYYIFEWQSAGVPAQKAVEVVYVGAVRGLQEVVVYVIDNTVDPNVPLEQVTVLASLSDPTPIEQKVTDSQGRASFSLQSGTEYVFTVRKDGYSFNRNNLTFTPQDTTCDDVPAALNTMFFFTGTFQPTFDPEQALDLSQLSKMTFRVVNMQGLPIVSYIVMVSNNYIPMSKTVGSTEYAVLGSPIELTTDENGYAETYLVRGMEVEVAFEGTPVRRTITVPDQASFELIGLVTAAGDPFDINEPNIPTGIRRS
jgi:hypothetical protein